MQYSQKKTCDIENGEGEREIERSKTTLSKKMKPKIHNHPFFWPKEKIFPADKKEKTEAHWNISTVCNQEWKDVSHFLLDFFI